jgi:tRNA pseudouridine55 synthase
LSTSKIISDLNFQEGELLLLHKPYGWTSFAVVSQLKKWTKAKIGHAGTLDPLAEGLMICCTGKFTKKLTHLTGLEKEYTGIITIGEQTPTYDLESLPENKKDISQITDEMILEVVSQFRGTITQFPPIHSAVKQSGKPVYELAREGKEVIMKSRTVTLHEFEIVKIDLPDIHFRIHCTSGTYIRSIAHDVGKALGVGGYLKKLVRTKIGEYDLANAYTIDALAEHFGSKMNAKIISPKVPF